MTTKSGQKTQFLLSPESNTNLNRLCGPCNNHIAYLEQHFKVKISNQGHQFVISCTEGTDNLISAKAFIEQLFHQTETDINESELKRLLKQNTSKSGTANCFIKTKKKSIQPATTKQNQFLHSLSKATINFAIGPAGTGKTFLSVAKGVEAFESAQVDRLVFVRPAVEAGERLGFLPGDMIEKVQPYLRPIYDALFELLGNEKTQRHIENNRIEIAPLAFMRGRTLNNAFITLDEAQNTTISQMKMFLTRLGYGSKMIITGDPSQIDLPKETKSGLTHAINLMSNIDNINITTFSKKDIVRHDLVAKILQAYDKDLKK